MDQLSIDLGQGVTVPRSEIQWRFSASGGPGGQHVNTSNTRAEATFDIEGSAGLPEWARRRLLRRLGPTISVAASDTRSQARNRDMALERLTDRVRKALQPPPPPRRPTRPTAASQRRRLDEKRRRARLKRDRRGRDDD